ncbi:MAG: hypothetical protein AC479_06840 [miscellaneous Crenarchaeota group-6 archaeon AD8-1]|nr:MAG: hypothetical protein AC479_06840 [miscellaneous Crenarchaeota group-6 archaeon AD8-1]
MPSKGKATKRTKTYESWSWNDKLLWSKVGPEDDRGCKKWLGSTGPHTGLFGAARNGKPQMTQARRALMMSMGVKGMEELSVRMRCNNDYCVNTDHMYTEPNRRLGLQADNRVDRGYTETRISIERWNDLTELQQTELKNLATSLQARVHFDHEFMYYSITWTTYAWFLARTKEPRLTDLLTVVYRKAE